MLLKAAQYLRVAPWDLADQPRAWMEQALAASEAEAYSARMHAKRQPAKT